MAKSAPAATAAKTTHQGSGLLVYQSADYDRFQMIKGNRTLDMNKIKRIMADIDRGTNLLPYCPVVVVEAGDKLEIIDGQHRYMVAKKIKSPVYYILATTLSLYDIARMNSNTEKWKGPDFINCYRELGNGNYARLEEILKQYEGLSITTAINLLMVGKVHSSGSGSKNTEKFQRGEFVVKFESITLKMLEKTNAFKLPYRYTPGFMIAIEKVMGAGLYSLDELAQKVNAAGLERQAHWREYLTAMEEIVSKGKQRRVAIY